MPYLPERSDTDLFDKSPELVYSLHEKQQQALGGCRFDLMVGW